MSALTYIEKFDDGPGGWFNIVNNFGIRHHNQQQKVHYDTAVWYSWMFYFFLATIHAAVGLLAKPVGKPA